MFIPVSQFDQIVWGSPSTEEMKSNGADVEMSPEEDPASTIQSASYNSVQNSVKVLHEESSSVWINVREFFISSHVYFIRFHSPTARALLV